VFAPASSYTEAFDREQGFTPAEWLYGLPRAVGSHPMQHDADGSGITVTIGNGTLSVRWTVLPPRQIALMRFPRLGVQFRFQNVPFEARVAFMRHFDGVMQRGGG
jgi:hypothetical protein